MHPAFQTPVGYLVLAAALVADPAIGADLDALPALNAAITESRSRAYHQAPSWRCNSPLPGRRPSKAWA